MGCLVRPICIRDEGGLARENVKSGPALRPSRARIRNGRVAVVHDERLSRVGGELETGDGVDNPKVYRRSEDEEE